jgi:hypothetical protein
MAPRLRPKQLSPDRQARERAARALKNRLGDLEKRIAEKEQAVRDLEHLMAGPGFYGNREYADAAVANHRTLSAEVRDLMSEWEALQTEDQTDKQITSG